MGDNIFLDFEHDRQYAEDLLDGITSGVCLFTISDEIKFLYFNRTADELFGYEKGGLLALTQQDSLALFHPDFEDRLYSEMIATLREERLFNYDCRILCKDGTYKWTNLSAQLQQKEGGCLSFYCVLSPTRAPLDMLLKDCHFLIASRPGPDCAVLTDLVEQMGGTFDLASSAPDALDLFSSQDGYHSIFITGSPVTYSSDTVCRVDSQASVMNGFELAKDLRYCSTPAGAEIPIILLASQEEVEEDEDDILDIAESLNVCIFLRNPLDEKALASFLSTLSKVCE